MLQNVRKRVQFVRLRFGAQQAPERGLLTRLRVKIILQQVAIVELHINVGLTPTPGMDMHLK